jgi:hypothetical protein
MAKLPNVHDRRPTPGASGIDQVAMPSVGGYDSIAGGINEFGRAMNRVKVQDDTVQAEAGINQYRQKLLDLENGDEGFKRIKSSGVVNGTVYKDYMGDAQTFADEITQGLGNDEQRELFKRRADVYQLQYGSNLTVHIQR